MAKILKPYTIIPANLYVNRDADRQVENIIEDMGRPGYVLVSRQMGKTNLLINAKRKLESPKDLFVYVDLSNPFDTSKACFENIINSALEINEERFGPVVNEIFSRRKVLVDTPPHKQHTNELRMLLKHIPGKLVIILDEIDALTKTPYSDQIFAQIRSVYFSRVNFPELERLTYILSGVVEPSEIIKDPKISPFNIGQKIFLNDFSKAEFSNLIKLSGLILSSELTERIYYWTHGNPRITWDVCAEVENRVLLSDSLTVAELDKIISDLYLTSFDKPPVDNIRGLVKQDREIRNALLDIYNHTADKISDKVKNKLYLAGITNYNESSIEIKNEVIRQSIRLDWIKSLEEEERGFIKLAIESYSNHDYKTAINYFEKYLTDHKLPDSPDKPHYYYMMAFSSYKLGSFGKSIGYLEETNFDLNDEPKSYYDVIYLKALCYTYLEQFDDAHANYKINVDSGRRDETFLKALINYGSVSIKAQKGELLDDALKIFTAIVEELNTDNIKIKELQFIEVKSIAYYNMAIIYSIKGDSDIANRYFIRAMELATNESKPVMMLAQVSYSNDLEQKEVLLEAIIERILFDKILIKEFDPEYPLQFSFDELKNIVIHCFLDFRDSLFLKLKEKIETVFSTPLGSIIYELAVEEINKQNWNDAYDILYSLTQELDNPTYRLNKIESFEILKYACYFNRTQTAPELYLRFANSFIDNEIENPDLVDIENFANLILQLTSFHRIEEALLFIEVIQKHKNLDPEMLINYLVIDHLELNIYKSLPDVKKTIDKAYRVIELSQDPRLRTQSSNLIGETGLDLIRKNAENVVRSNTDSSPVKNQKKYGRNDLVKVRYHDGVTLETKFKKVESDISEGMCIILN